MSVHDHIRLEHGSGGALSRDLIDEIVFPRFRGSIYKTLSDATPLGLIERPCLTTDSFVVDPLFFAGSDIGKLAVFGTCNDLAVSGAMPVALTLGCILEEGFAIAEFERVLDSIAEACKEASVGIVTGDTKVVPRGAGSGIYLNTAGIGNMVVSEPLGADRISVGDAVIFSGPVGAHGIAVLAAREGLPVAGGIVSDCRPLYSACSRLFDLGPDLRVMRDATRGGVAAVTNELVSNTDLSILLEEARIPVLPAVEGAAATLGLNPLEIANEGVFVAVVAADRADEAVDLLKKTGTAPEACVVGSVTDEPSATVVLTTRIGGRRIVDLPRGLLLPRIC